MIQKIAVLLSAFAALAAAEVRTMTLRQAVDTALKQNPDIALVRLDEEKAKQAVRVAKDPFTPHITVGSGLAYTNGFPMSVEGSAPSVFQANATRLIFNRPQSYAVAQAKENVRGAALAVTSKSEEVAYRTASLFLDAERAARVGDLARKDAESLQQVLDAIRAQVQEGRALPLAEKQAAYNLARAKALAESLEDDQTAAETSLALALGFSLEDRVRPAAAERPAPQLPPSEEAAAKTAMEANKDLRRIQSQILAKELEMRGYKSQRLPRADLVAQYSVLARFNNYDQFFRTFQRNNGQIGVSFQLPIFTGPGISAQVAQGAADVSRLKIEYTTTRNQILSDVQSSYREVRRAETAAEVARLDLDAAREQLSVLLAQIGEGRATMRQAEEARIAENDKWVAFYDAQYTIEKTRWNVLRLTGELAAYIQAQ